MSEAPQPTSTTPALLTQEEWFSSQLVLVIQLVFAVVIAESLGEYRKLVLDPFKGDNKAASLALIVVYLTALWSWLRWHKSIAGLRYRLMDEPSRKVRAVDGCRFYLDLLIVIAYAYLLFFVDSLVGNPDADLRRFIDGYAVVGALYVAWSVARQPFAYRRLTRNFGYVAMIVILRVLYVRLRHDPDLIGFDFGRTAQNYLVLGAVLAITASYRFIKPSWR